MDLRAYLTDNALSIPAFAAQIGVSHVTLYRYLSGHRRPHWDVLQRIESTTGGQVTPNDFSNRNTAA